MLPGVVWRHPCPQPPHWPKDRVWWGGATDKGSDLEEPPELGPAVASFLRGSPETSKDEGNRAPLEPTVLEFSQWVPWKAEKCETPDWWTKLLTVPGMEVCRKLAREVWTSFQLPQWMQELGMGEANLHAPPMPPCLGRQRFMLLAESIYACRDIREIPWEKVVAYARALQHWAEENILPAGGGPCLLAESVMEFREEVKWYLSFSNEEVFWGVALPKKEEDQSLKTLSANVPKAPCVSESTMEKRGPRFLGWEKVLHPSQLVVAAGEIPQPSKASSQKWDQFSSPRLHQQSLQPLHQRLPTHPNPPHQYRHWHSYSPPTPLHGFAGVTACLQTPELVEVALEAPLGTMPIGLVVTPGISTMSMSHIMRDKATGIMYMDTVTTSIGRVALSGPDSEASSPGPTIKDITGHE